MVLFWECPMSQNNLVNGPIKVVPCNKTKEKQKELWEIY
jgi:hypothetical protein